jgi:hypothetical protein
MAALVVFVVVAEVGPAFLEAARLSWSPLVVAGVVAALTGAVSVVKPIADAYAQAWARWPVRWVERAQRRKELVEAVTGGRGFPRIRDIRDHDRSLLGIHPAIPLPADADPSLSVELPTYVLRDIDTGLRAWLAERQHTGGFLLLVGPAAAGKTRTLYEALRVVVPKWRLILPMSGAQVNELAAADVDLSRTVVWLNDIPTFLGAEGLTAATVRRLLADRERPVLLVGTIWPDLFDALTRPAATDGTQQDLGRDAREILSVLATRFDLTSDFSRHEQERARALAHHDPRLAEATHLNDPHIAQTLAAAPELIRRWRNPANPYGAAVITAAVTARRCGHPEPIPESVLRPLAEHVLAPTERATAPTDWFTEALDWARQPVRGKAAPLTPHASSVGTIDGHRVSDVLVEHAATNPDAPGHTISAESWRLLLAHAAPGACADIGRSAYLELEKPDSAQRAFFRAAEAGDARGMFNLGYLLEKRGDEAEAESWYRRAADAGNAAAMTNLGILLKERGDEAAAEVWWRRAAAAGSAAAMFNLGYLLEERGDEAQAESWWRRAAKAGSTFAKSRLGLRLRERQGRAGEKDG